MVLCDGSDEIVCKDGLRGSRDEWCEEGEEQGEHRHCASRLHDDVLSMSAMYREHFMS